MTDYETLVTADDDIPNKKYTDDAIASAAVQYKGGYDAATNTPDLDSGSPVAIVIGDMYTTTVAGTFFTVPLEVGDLIIAEINSALVEADWTVLRSSGIVIAREKGEIGACLDRKRE